jgi:molecular chaperone GrpE
MTSAHHHDDTAALTHTIEHLQHEIETLESQVNDNLSGWKRALADFENYKKQNNDQLKDLQSMTLASVLQKLSPVIELMETAVTFIPREHEKESWYVGLQRIQEQWLKFLKTEHVEIIDPVGSVFDPQYHVAVSIRHEEDTKDDEILEVLSKGYRHREYVIKPASVIVNHVLKNN